MEILGIDIGGSGIKGAPVDIKTGKLCQERYRLPTPSGAKPPDVARVVHLVVKHFKWKKAVGCGFPAALRNGRALTASNIHKDWIGTNVESLLRKKTGCRFTAINDADAAGLAEFTFGAGRKKKGVVIVITIGTGLGTSVFTDGVLLPRTELGHIELNGITAEEYASDAVRKNFNLSWEKWAKRFDEYLDKINFLFWPDLIILGGGASKKPEKFFEYLTCPVKILPARLKNNAGIIGAALSARGKSVKS